MRRQRTASESGATNGSESDNERESLSDTMSEKVIEEVSDNVSDEDMESTEHDSENNIDSEGDNSNSDDSDNNSDDSHTDDEHDMDYDSYDDEEDSYGSDDDEVSHQLDIMNQLQSALFGMTSTAMTHSDLERLRQQITAAGGLFSSGPATHSSQIRSIIRSLPESAAAADPMVLYSTFTELWEMIVLTGEEVEAYEFDTVVDLKPLLPHLLRVLKWEQDCQIYGGEFLLYAVRCTRACVQYSPGCARRLVESGLVPLITRQLFSVEYIDLAEDLIQIIQILTKSGVHSKACLHADGIRAVLGFVDFFALSVQVNAFTAAAQMTTALTDDTLHLYLPPETAALLRSTAGRFTETDSQVLKLVHQATHALSNAIQAAPGHVDELCPGDFVSETLLPMAAVHPLDSASLLLKLLSISKTAPQQLATNISVVDFIKTLLKTAATNENLLETTLKLVIDFFCQSAEKPLQELMALCLRNKNMTKIEELNCVKDEAVLGQVSDALFEFYLNSPSMTLSSRHSTLCALLLLDDCQTAPVINLVKMGALSRLLTGASADPLVLVIGLEWCRVLSRQREEFASTALRQGLPSELHTVLNDKQQPLTDEPLKKWLQMRMELVGKVVNSEESLQMYVKHFTNEILLLTERDNEMNTRNVKIGSVKELLELMKSETFTEYEWLGDTETCLARQLYDLLKDNETTDGDYEPICDAIYKALNRYDSLFTLTLPLAKLTRATSSNPLEALAILARPLRVHLTNEITKSEKLVVCDPFACIGWIVKMGSCGDEERKMILRETASGNDGSEIVERIYDTLEANNRDVGGYGIVDISSTAFISKHLQVHLHYKDDRVPLQPASSLIEVLFANVLQGSDKWKKVNEIWSSGTVVRIVISESVNIRKSNRKIKVESSTANTSTVANTSNDTLALDNKRVKLALDLLSLIPFKTANDHLSSKLAKELDSPLLIAVNGISWHWLQTAQSYHFLYPFALRLSLMKTVCSGRLRALWILQQRANNSVELNSVVSLPRRKFRIHREQFLQCLKNVFTPANCGDLRLFEFEYAGELGTGHGPTMEFYALASECFKTENTNGLFPNWKTQDFEDEFRLIGSLVARAWLDDRIIDIPINPIFLQSLVDEFVLEFDHLKLIDPELYNSLKSTDNLIGSDLTFVIPGTDTCLLPRDREIKTAGDAEEFRALLVKRINECMIKARGSFLQGFNQSYPCSFHECIKYFTVPEVSRLFSQSLDQCDWTPQTVLSVLVPDHGYTPASPQIRWLAEMIGETEGYENRGRLVRFLTGAVYLPIGGWKALRPPLTIVCKSDDSNVTSSLVSAIVTGASTSDNNTPTLSTPILSTPTPSTISSDTTNSFIHDSYLPSVMTCANYLKLPRYSSKAIMKERFEYAIREGCDSFHLS